MLAVGRSLILRLPAYPRCLPAYPARLPCLPACQSWECEVHRYIASSLPHPRTHLHTPTPHAPHTRNTHTHSWQGQEACSRNVNPPSSLGFRVHSPQLAWQGSWVHGCCPHPPVSPSLHLSPPPLYLQVCRQEPRTLVVWRTRQTATGRANPSTRRFVPQAMQNQTGQPANQPSVRSLSLAWAEGMSS